MSENIPHGPPPLLGPRLAQLRAHKGLSIQELADSLGSSPSAIHRYESGWGQFELRTLRRLAAALGARLEIRLEPQETHENPITPGELVHRLRPLFWDVDLMTAHLEENPQWVLRRVLQFGGWKDVRDARRYFGDEAVREAAEHRSMDARTSRFWRVVLAREPSTR